MGPLFRDSGHTLKAARPPGVEASLPISWLPRWADAPLRSLKYILFLFLSLFLFALPH